ncbi:ChrR family anti-sigma-E factor [Paracraurococcus lichenis]|uniref:ChrR family anti-sigma-E factor n=1 Tax=Paracraurococcus lichenis TaxID=3064888 RepID=A0ABT9ECU2_9PROT|nr:ChrR family anti-sigma-E factor [Paracraurococcus sp. LOR1-02]MDO9714004.1 ChrR family anti-sigma-E factor [Paracraurococcus sp. LOR1-02]
MYEICHHPSDPTLVAHAAGRLSPAAATVVRLHLELCATCRAAMREAEAIGGALLACLPAEPLGPEALARAMRRIDAADAAGRMGPPVPAAPPLTREVLAAQRLRWLAPGVRHCVVLDGTGGEVLRLLRVRPGTALPQHGHHGTELTLVLEGAFRDVAGHYRAGDVLEVDEETRHMPAAEGPTDCFCLLATQGRLRFDALLPRIFGLLVRL